jgi:hypothetical protein
MIIEISHLDEDASWDDIRRVLNQLIVTILQLQSRVGSLDYIARCDLTGQLQSDGNCVHLMCGHGGHTMPIILTLDNVRQLIADLAPLLTDVNSPVTETEA